MLRKVGKVLLERRYLHRGLVLLFFIMTLADIASPQNCGEDVWGLLKASPSQSSVQAPADFGREAAFISADPQQPQPSSDSDSAPADDDCICCCSHILPGVVFHVDEPELAPSLSEPTATTLPTAPPQSAFHPPRLS